MSNVHTLSTAQAAKAASLASQIAVGTVTPLDAYRDDPAMLRACINDIMGTLALFEGGQIGREEALKRIRDDVRPFLRSQVPA